MNKSVRATNVDDFFEQNRQSTGTTGTVSNYRDTSSNPESSTRGLTSQRRRNDNEGTTGQISAMTGFSSMGVGLSSSSNSSYDFHHESNDVRNEDPRTNIRKLIDCATELKNLDIPACLTEYKMMMEGTDPTKLTQEETYVKSKTFDSTCADASPRELKATIERLRKERDSYKDETEKLRRGLELQIDEIHNAQMFQDEKDKLEEENKKLNQEVSMLREKREENLEEWKKILNDKMAKDLEKEESYKDEIEKLKQNLKSNRETLKKRENEKAEALNRLSKEMGNKLNNKNPNIADLSDSNRPTKIAEKYNELYDNEWTDALETLTKDKSEDIAIRYLLEILLTCNQFCQLTSSEQMKNMFRQLSEPSSSNYSYSVSKQEVIPPELEQLLNECRKAKGIISSEHLYKEYLKHPKRSHYAMDVPEYVKKCLEVCWSMIMHDPCVTLGEPCKSGDKFDGSKYKHYTKTGDTVSFTVWVPLLLHANGPLLSKGVAQPIATNVESRAKSAPAKSTRQTSVDTKTDRLDNYTKNIENTYHDRPKQTNTGSHVHAWRDHTTGHSEERWPTTGLTTAQYSKEPAGGQLQKTDYGIGTNHRGDTYKTTSYHVPQETSTQYSAPYAQNAAYNHWSYAYEVYHHGTKYIYFNGKHYTEKQWYEFKQNFIKDTNTNSSFA